MPASVELLPDTAAEVATRLRVTLQASGSLRAAIAFWTIDPALMGPDLTRNLGAGFLCVDIHYPTSIDQLALLAQAGANVFLHLFDLAGQTEVPGIVGVPHHLMHAKTLLFDLPSNTSALWVGSHNWTQRSLFAVNIEASLVVGMDPGDPLYQQSASFLESVRGRCLPFDLNLIDYYKWLQGEDGTEYVIELEDQTGGSIPGNKLTVFGTLKEDHRQLSKVGNQVYVSITSSSGEIFYRATVVNSGEQTKAAGKGVSLDERRYAFRRGSQLPVLEPPQVIPQAVMDEASYFATLDLVERLPAGTRAVAPPETQRWVEEPDQERVRHLPKRDWTGRRGDRPPKVRRAVDVEVFRDAVPSRLLADRRSDRKRALVTSLILVVPGEEKAKPDASKHRAKRPSRPT